MARCSMCENETPEDSLVRIIYAPPYHGRAWSFICPVCREGKSDESLKKMLEYLSHRGPTYNMAKNYRWLKSQKPTVNQL